MDFQKPSRLLSIGEFSSATQLSPKALRLYAEQNILRPAVVDAANGYRYYRDDQIATGRLIRMLRDMDVSLASVVDVISANDAGSAEALLRRLADDGERRHARRRRAFHAALPLLRQGTSGSAPTVTTRARAAMTVAVRPFLAGHQQVVERFCVELAAGLGMLAQAGVVPSGEPFCVLVDPLSEEEGRVEAVIPVAAPSALPSGITLRHAPACDCAVLVTEVADAGAFDPTSALDALFDWFDRRGCHAVEPPALSFASGDTALRTEIVWAYEPVSTFDSSR